MDDPTSMLTQQYRYRALTYLPVPKAGFGMSRYEVEYVYGKINGQPHCLASTLFGSPWDKLEDVDGTEYEAL